MSIVHRSAAIDYATNTETYARGRPDYPPEVDQWLQSRLRLGPNQTVLDLGAGTGKFSKKLSATGAKVFALDPVPAMLEQLSREQPLIETRLSSADSLPFQPPLDHRLPRHEAERSAIVQHCKAAARQHHAATVDAVDALTISHGPKLKAGLGSDVLRRLRNFYHA